MARILVVEDDESIASQVKQLLEWQEYTVEVRHDGIAADELLARDDFHLLLLDWDLPGMTGRDICRNYRARGGLAPVLMVTGNTGIDFKESAFEAGADDYLTKPFHLRELSARVKAMLRRTEQLTASAQVQEPPKILDRTGDQDPFIGVVFSGKYKIIELIGQGGAGSVYAALHLGLNRRVAVKFLHSFLISRQAARSRFQREARTLSQIDHPNMVQVFDFGIEHGQPFIVMELVEGYPLSYVLAETGPLKSREALPIFLQICDAMAVAHQQGIIHRDLKPDNVILLGQKHATGATIKLVDLGLAKDVGDQERVTDTGMMVGTAEYMSPEQVQGLALDARSDLYSMGCLMFATFTGTAPFLGEDYMEIVRKHLFDAPPGFAAKLTEEPGMSGVIERIVLQALAKNPDQRQQSFMELKAQLLALT